MKASLTLSALALIALPLETWSLTFSYKWLAAMAYQIFIPGLAATLIWFALVRRIGAVKGSAFHFLNPFFGIVIAWLVLGERLHWIDAFGVTIIMAGILAVQLSKVSKA